MNSGKVFEEALKKSVDEKSMYYYRLKDPASSFGQDSSKTRFSLSNEYDCFIFYKSHLFTLELKSSEQSSISIQREKTEKSKSIKLNQIEGLKRSAKYGNVKSGFMLDFRTTKNTYFLSIDEFMRFLTESDKKSINEKDVIEYNGVVVESRLLQVNYRYNLVKLFDSLIQ